MWSFRLLHRLTPGCRHAISTRRTLSSTCSCRRPNILRFNKGVSANSRRTFLSAVSATGFNDYEVERKRFQWNVPKFYNFADVMDSWAEKEQNGQRPGSYPALWWVHEDGREEKYRFQDVQHYSKKIANILTRDCYLEKGDIVMVILGKVPEWWFINIASVRAGLVLIPGTSLLRSGDIKDRLLRSKAKCIIADDILAQEIDMIANECPDLETKLLVSPEGGSRAGWLDYRELLEKASPLHKNVKTSSDETFLAFFTSGTTGKPKLIEHSHASGSLGHLVTGRYWYDLVPTDIIQCLSDTGWAKAAYGNLYGPWIQGACVFIHQSQTFDPEQVLHTLDRYPISVFCAPPTAYRMLIQHDIGRFDLRSIRHWVGAGEPMNPEVIEVWRKLTDLQLYEAYGQSETTVLIAMYKCLKYRPTSMGKPPPGVEVAIVADDMSTELPPGEEGNIAVPLRPRGTVGLFKGYMTDAARTSEVFGRDYYLTGDRGYMDEDGYYYFVARDDDIITSAGYRIGPFEVESALQEHPAVVESGAVAVKDGMRGEVVKAFIVLAEGFKDRNPEELKKELQEHVKNVTAPYKYPRQIAFVDHLPKTVSGKIRRVELRENW